MLLKEFRDKAHGLPDLLPFAALVDDGIVLTKSGGFLAAFEFRGPDLDSATAAELGSMASRVNGAFKLDDGWAIFVDAVRTPAPGYMPQGAFPDRTTRLLDDVRRLSHEADDTAGFESRFYLTLLWHPEPDAASRVEATFIEGRGESGTAARSLTRFKQALAEISDRMLGVVKIRRLVDTGDGGNIKSELLGHLQSCVTFDQRGPYRLPAIPMYLDALIGRRPFVTGFEPKVGKTTVIPVSIVGFPGRSYPGMLDFLSRLPVEYRWSNRFIYLNERQADKVLSGYRSRWGQKRLSLMNLIKSNAGGQVTHVNLDADEMANDAVVALSENSSGIVRYGYYTSTILLYGEDTQLVRDSARRVVKQVVNIGFDARIEEVNAVEAYLGSIPGNIVANVRRPLINTANLSHLLPMTAVWPGLHLQPCPFYPKDSPVLLQAQTDGSTPYRLCLHAGDLGHTAIIGPTGSGKSTLVATLAAQHFRYPNARVFAFDKGYSMQPLAWATGGQHYDIAGDADDISFCPLASIHQQAELEWTTEWVEQLCELQGVEMTPEYRKEVLRALKQLADSTTEASQRTITNFVLELQDQTLRDAVNQYTLSGIGGRLLDAESDSLQEDIFQVFEMEHLLNRGDRIVLPVLSYLFHRLEQRFNGEPTLLILDEAWILLGHPIFKAKIREWLKVLRKRNVAVVFATLGGPLASPPRRLGGNVQIAAEGNRRILPGHLALQVSAPFEEVSKVRSELVDFPGSFTTLRLYHKGPEFREHEIARVKRALTFYALAQLGERRRASDWELSDRGNVEKWVGRKLQALQRLGDNRLRAEVQVNAEKLDYDFKRVPLVSDITDDYLKKVHDDEVFKLLREGKTEMETVRTNDQVVARLNRLYGKRTANSLYSFWTQMTTRGEEVVSAQYGKSQFYVNRKKLVLAGVSWLGSDIVVIANETALPRDFVPLRTDFRLCRAPIANASVFNHCPVQWGQLRAAA